MDAKGRKPSWQSSASSNNQDRGVETSREMDDCCLNKSKRWTSKGLSAKQKDSPYRVTEKPSRDWFKVKNPKYSQLEGREDCSSACEALTRISH